MRALETVLTEKGYIDPAALDAIIDTYQTRVGPRNGAQVVARAWSDPGFMEWLLRDASATLTLARFDALLQAGIALREDDLVEIDVPLIVLGFLTREAIDVLAAGQPARAEQLDPRLIANLDATTAE